MSRLTREFKSVQAAGPNTGSRVFICFEAMKMNFAGALRFGEIVYVASQDVNAASPSSVKRVSSEVKSVLRSFDPDEDYLVLVGSPILIAMCATEIMLTHRRMTVLQWDRQDSVYVPVRLESPA